MERYHIRRSDRELTDATDIESVLRRGRFAAVAMCHEGEPYVVTLSYGYDPPARALYFHVAPEGRKLDAIAEDPRVCATVVIDGGYERGACKHHYESVVITGTMRLVDDAEERRHGMRVLLGHLEDDPERMWKRHQLEGDEIFGRMSVARLDIGELTGKAGS
jgi:nitroimidazol reductase NimA-like FMN-containing flavoprotein (pyridoxamine 5'-phosphate oxidase superfamily)